MSFEIRPVQEKDLPAILQLYEPLATQAGAPLSEAALRGECSHPGAVVLAAWLEATLVGFIAGVRLAEEEAEIRYLGVDPCFWGRGVGRALMADFRLRIGERAKIFLEVSVANTRALAFYERLGAVKINFRHNYYKETGAWVMAIK